MIRRRRTVVLVLLGLALLGAGFSGAAFVSGSTNPTNLFTGANDWVAPTVSSIDRHTSSPSNGGTVQWDVTFSESVTGVDASDFQLVNTGLGGTPQITNVTGSGSTYTVTASTGTGNGSLGLNLVDDDSIADGSGNKLGGAGTGNGDFTGQVYSIDRTAPAFSTLEMFDTNGNGKVDQLKATFDENLANSTSTAGWSFTSAPGGATLKSVSTSGKVATLTLNEGTADTSVGSFTVSLDSGTGDIQDSAGNHSSFSNKAPSDKAAPVVVSLSKGTDPTNAASVSWAAKFSESVTGVGTADFKLINTGLGGPPAITGVTGSGASYTVTASTGSGNGSLGLNLVDDDSIKDTSSNTNVLVGPGTADGGFTGDVYTIDRTKPTFTKLEFFDANGNGKVDQVKATFNETMGNVTSTTGWSVSNAPSGSNTISGISSSGSVVTLTLNEGATVSTAVGTFTVSLNSTNNTTDQAGNTANAFTGQTPQDKAAPVVVSLSRVTAAQTNLSSLQWTATFSESVTGVDTGDFQLAATGPTGTSLTSVTGSGTTRTITANSGSGDGTLGLNLVDDDTIKDSSANTNALVGAGTADGGFTGQIYSIDKTAPSLTSLVMFDTDGNGKVDQVKATFDETLQSSTATAGWTLANMPGGATNTLSSVSTSGSVATLNLSQTTANQNTAAGSFTVALSAATGDIKDATGNKSSFAAQGPQDSAAPVVISLNRASASPTNNTSVDWTATFSESVSGVDNSDFAVAQAGGVTGASVSSVTGSGATRTVTAAAGSNDGTLGLNLVDDDSITDTSSNNNALVGAGKADGGFTGQVYTIDRTAPTLSTLEMFDADKDGKVDQVKATFNETLASSTATTGWSLSNAPGGAGNTLSSVSTSTTVATLALNEGTVNTAAGSFQVALDGSTGDITDAAGNKASFSGTQVDDKAGPVPTAFADTNGSTDGLFQTGDTLTVSFSENVTGYPATSSVVLTDGAGNDANADLLTAPGLFAAQTALGTPPAGVDYMSGKNGATANFFGGATASTLAQGATAKDVKLTLGTCNATSNCSNLHQVTTGGAFTYTPDPVITDSAKNAATGSLPVSAIKLF
jgi:hypothetical protein